MAQRYEMKKDGWDNWMVIDRFTGWVAERQGITLDDLDMEEADDLVDLLNLKDLAERQGKGLA